MNERDEMQWSEEEAQRLSALARQQAPAPELEDRVVARLKGEGLLGGRPRPWWQVQWMPWALAGTAALFAVFLLGYSVGQQAGAESALSMMAEIRQARDVDQAIANVQRTGSAYVTALAALGHLAASSPDQSDRRQSQEVALSALYAAAQEMVRLDPDDPVAARLLQGLEAERLRQVSHDETQEPSPRKVFWN